MSHHPPSCPDCDIEEPSQDFSSSVPTENSISDNDSSPCLSKQAGPTLFMPISQSDPIANSPTATPSVSQLIGVHLSTSMPEVSPTAVLHDAPTQTSTPECLLTAVSLDNPARPWYGFKLVGDNIDKNVRLRHQTLQCQTQSFHYFKSYAIKDRLDLSAMSDDPSMQDVEVIDINSILRSVEDHEAILKNFATIAGRIIVKYISAFEKIARSDKGTYLSLLLH